MKTIKLPCFDITVQLGKEDPEHPGLFLGGTITSSLHDNNEPGDADFEEFNDYNRMIDGIEAMILGHAVAGIDIESTAYIEGIETAVEAASNHS